LVVYADSSFLVSLFIEDSNSGLARNYLVQNPERVSFNSFSKSEAQHAIRTLVFQKDINLAEMTRALLQFEHDEAEGFLRSIILENDAVFEKASQLSNRYAVEHGVRYLDMLHVASALLANAKRFLTFDRRQRKFAQAAGLDVKI
jgi:predicted nucleic acid-binding protein